MIRTEIHIVVGCDHCETGLPADSTTTSEQAPEAAHVFADRLAALAAIDAAVRFGGWAHRLGGGTFPEDGTYGWRVCGCERSIPAHAAAVDPAGGPGCGMVWRLCGRCDHINEHHATEHQLAEHGGVVHQPGGSFRQVVPTGLALSHHHDQARQGAREDGRQVADRDAGDAAIVGAELGRWSR